MGICGNGLSHRRGSAVSSYIVSDWPRSFNGKQKVSCAEPRANVPSATWVGTPREIRRPPREESKNKGAITTWDWLAQNGAYGEGCMKWVVSEGGALLCAFHEASHPLSHDLNPILSPLEIRGAAWCTQFDCSRSYMMRRTLVCVAPGDLQRETFHSPLFASITASHHDESNFARSSHDQPKHASAISQTVRGGTRASPVRAAHKAQPLLFERGSGNRRRMAKPGREHRHQALCLHNDGWGRASAWGAPDHAQ